MRLKNTFLAVCLIFSSFIGIGQDVYKTPSGKKYHLFTCRMVKNVSIKLDGESGINKYNLTPCKICNPPKISDIQKNDPNPNKAVGESISLRCKGRTKKGTRCLHKTKLANGYCYQHTSQNSNLKSNKTYEPARSPSPTCGAKNKSGGYCKRKVKSGGYCYQHQ